MNEGSTVFTQLMANGSRFALDRCIRRYKGNRKVRSFSCRDQFLVMAFAQLTYRESLRDIEACLGAVPDRLYHMGVRGSVSRTTLADANENRDWRIYADFAQVLIAEARRLYANEPLATELDHTVYALDSSMIDLCASVFPWAYNQQSKSAIKLNTLLDLRGNIPAFIRITTGKFRDVHILDELIPEPGSIYVMDRGYTDFARLFAIDQSRAIFIIRGKRNLNFRRIRSRPVDRSTGLICDQVIRLVRPGTARLYPSRLRRIRACDPETRKRITVLSNDFLLPAKTIADLYRSRWQVELFFRWIKQHLRIKRFYGTTPNAVRTQIWIAICVYVLVAIARKRLRVERELYTILQILSLSLFEKVPLQQALTGLVVPPTGDADPNQLQLLDL